MKNYIVGAIIGGLVMVSGTMVYAATQGASGLSVVDGTTYLTKYYDKDADVICYAYDVNGYVGGISCLHH